MTFITMHLKKNKSDNKDYKDNKEGGTFETRN